MSDKHLEQVKADFQARAPNYGEHVKTYRDPQLKELMLEGLQACRPLTQTMIALDLGCGQGDGSKHLREAGIDVWYIDASQEMIRKGIERGNISPERTVTKNIEDIGFPEDTFDIVMCRYAIHDVENKAALLQRIRRSTKQNGLLQIIEMCAPSAEQQKVKEFYNFYHMWKTSGEPRQCWIPNKKRVLRPPKK